MAVGFSNFIKYMIRGFYKINMLRFFNYNEVTFLKNIKLGCGIYIW